MTFIAQWPAAPHIPAGCEAFDTEASALVKARAMTAAGVARVTVYEIADEHIDPELPIEEKSA